METVTKEVRITKEGYKYLRSMTPWWVKVLHFFKIPYTYTIVKGKKCDLSPEEKTERFNKFIKEMNNE